VTQLPAIPVSPVHEPAAATQIVDDGPRAMVWWHPGSESDDDPEEESKSEAEEDVCPIAAEDDPSDPHPDTSSKLRAVLEWLRSHADRIRTQAGPAELEPVFARKALTDLLDSRRPTAPGPDHIPILFLRYGGSTLHSALLSLFNYSWVHGVLPLDWRSSHVKPLYKGKGLRTDPINLRPVALTSCVVRVMECLILDRLSPYAESHHLLSPQQFGFRKGRSTYDAVFVLTEWIKEQLCDKGGGPVPVAFLDLVKAYDRIWQEGLLYRLAHVGITGRAWCWIAGFLKGRRFRVVAGSLCSQWRQILASVPQGTAW
jgi:hypothetical protein